MLTIRAEIKKQEQKLDGTYNVKLRFTLDRKVKRLSTSLFVTNKDLSKDLKIKQTSPIKQEVDNLIRSYQEKCAKLQIELNHYTLDEVMDYLNGERQRQQTIDFIKFSREWIASTTTIKGVQRINIILKEVKKKYRLHIGNFSCHSLRKTFDRQVYNMNSENSELALVKLMELFNHSSVAITKRYLGLRQEELLNTYDSLSF